LTLICDVFTTYLEVYLVNFVFYNHVAVGSHIFVAL